MTYKEIEHIKVCKQLMSEAANRIDMTINYENITPMETMK